MSINKNFVVRHGFEASTDLILADADTRKVGIGTTRPRYDFTVAGGIGATDFYLTGIGTFVNELNVGLGGTVLTVLGLGNSIGIGTTLPEYLVDIRSPVSTGQTALYIQGDVRITGDIQADDTIFDDAIIDDLTINNTFYNIGVSTFLSYVYIDDTLEVTGITTLGSYVDINDDVDISGALNVGGISTLGGYVDINNSLDVAVDLNVGGATTLGNYVNILSDLNVSGITTLATADINAGEIDVSRIETGDLSVTGIATIATISVVGAALSSLIVSGIGTIQTADINAGEIDVSRIETGDLSVTGITTLGTVEINAGIITAVTGVVTYYGDGQYLDLSANPTAGIGIGTTGGVVGYGITFIDFYGAGVSTAFYDSNVGIATIFFEGGGSGTIGIGLTFPDSASNGDLFYSAEYGRLFVYYDEVEIGVGSSAFWVDAAPFNVNLSQLDSLSLINLTVSNNTNLLGITTANLLNVTGITTLTNLIVGDINSSGIVTAIDFNSTSDKNLKYNVETVKNALDTVGSLRGVSFNWKENDRKSYGVIAQELEEVLPDLVSDGEIKTVNYNGLIGVLIEAVKELKKEIEDLKNTK